MSTQIKMDHTGDTRYDVNPKDALSVKQAMERFDQLIAEGFTAAKKTGPGTSEVTREYDPTAEETIFIPRLQGG